MRIIYFPKFWQLFGPFEHQNHLYLEKIAVILGRGSPPQSRVLKIQFSKKGCSIYSPHRRPGSRGGYYRASLVFVSSDLCNHSIA